jgi:hypothetical protein
LQGISITYGNGKFVIATGTEKIRLTTDTTTFTDITKAVGTCYPRFIAFGNGRFVGVEQNSNKACYSDDGGVT